MASPPTPTLKVVVLHDRDQSRDEETWQKWWSEELMPRIMPFALKHGIDRAELVCPSISREVKSTLGRAYTIYLVLTWGLPLDTVLHPEQLQERLPGAPGPSQGTIPHGLEHGAA